MTMFQLGCSICQWVKAQLCMPSWNVPTCVLTCLHLSHWYIRTLPLYIHPYTALSELVVLLNPLHLLQSRPPPQLHCIQCICAAETLGIFPSAFSSFVLHSFSSFLLTQAIGDSSQGFFNFIIYCILTKRVRQIMFWNPKSLLQRSWSNIQVSSPRWQKNLPLFFLPLSECAYSESILSAFHTCRFSLHAQVLNNIHCNSIIFYSYLTVFFLDPFLHDCVTTAVLSARNAVMLCVQTCI